MKLFNKLLAVVLCLSMVFGIAACAPEAAPPEVAPTISITSAEGTITVEESYTLAYTATDSKSETVAVTEKDGKTGGSYNSSTKVFTATMPGEYTLTVTAKNVTKTATAAVKVTVTEAPDTTAPVLAFPSGSEKAFTVAAGQTVMLPKATATDNKDGAVEVLTEVTSKGATLEAAENGIKFTSNTAGKYKVSYYAIDAAENDVEEFIDVTVTPVIAESVITDAENKLENLNTSELTYKENFKDGYDGTFAKGLVFASAEGGVKSSIESNSNSIAGNSLMLDYSTCAPDTNTQYFLSGLSPYLKSGKWSISMDVKIISGKAPSNSIYYSFIFDGDNDGDNTPIALGAVGETKTITLNSIKTLDPSKKWHFRTFFFTGDPKFDYGADGGLKIAIDNIVVTWKDVVDATAERKGTPVTIDAADLDAGVTITGADDNYTALAGRTSSDKGSMLYLYKDKLVQADRLTKEQADLLTPANGFNSNYVILASTQICTFDSLKNLMTDSKYNYTLTFKVFSPSSSGWHIFFTNGAGEQSSAAGMTTVNGVSTFTTTIKGAANLIHAGLYNGGSTTLYIGDISLKREMIQTNPEVTRTGTPVTVTAAQVSAEGGYTITGTDTNYTALSGNGNAVYVDLDIMVAAEKITKAQRDTLNAESGFGTKYAIMITQEITNFDAIKNLMTDPTKEYTVTYKVFSMGASAGTNWHMWNGGSLASASNTTGVKTITKTIAGAAANANVGVYVEGSKAGNFLLVGDITVVATDRVVGDTTPNGHAVGKTWSFDANSPSFSPVGGAKFTKVDSSSVALAEGTLEGQEGFGAKVYQTTLASDTTHEITRLNNITEANCDYEVTFVVYIKDITGKLMVRADNNFVDLATATGVQTIKITLSNTVDYLSFYCPGGSTATVYLSSVTVKLVAIK